MRRLGTVLIVLGLFAIGYGLAWQLGLAPGSRVTLPEPVALERAAPGSREVSALSPIPSAPTPAPVALATAEPPSPTPVVSVQTAAARLPTMSPTLVATPLPRPTSTPTPAPGVRVPLVPADAADRAAPPSSGYAVRLTIPAIKVDTVVEQGGIVDDPEGQPVWETLPFVAVHYGDLTAKIGAPGNAVIAGHVVTLNEGNVFRFLYQLDIGDRIDVWDQMTREHEFQVVGVKLVPPTDTSVMDPTTDETLTLITCGGTFDPVKREFSDRLIVIAKPL